MPNKEKLVVLIGPTAVGKTKLSIELAKQLNGEIISGDSMQIYRGLDIGTAKITKEEMEGIPHHLIDLKDPDEPFSVAEFQQIVREKITEITKRKKLPMIVGGTGLYIQSVIYDYQFSPQNYHNKWRKILEKKLEIEGSKSLYDELKQIDPKSAEKIHPNNHRRVIRALEIYYSTGKTMSDYLAMQANTLLYEAAIIGLTMEREKLYERINQRVDEMIQKGLIDEVKRLYDQGLRNCQSIQAIGYKELYAYFDGLLTLEEAIELLKKNTRRYAKRQYTWFKNKMDVEWFDVTKEPFDQVLKKIIHYIAGKLHLKENK